MTPRRGGWIACARLCLPCSSCSTRSESSRGSASPRPWRPQRCSCAAGALHDELTRIIDQGRSASRAAKNPPPLAAHAVLGGALGLLYARLSARDPVLAGGAPEPVDVADRSPLPWRFGSTQGAIPPTAGASLREWVKNGLRGASTARRIHRGLSCNARGSSSPRRKLSASSLCGVLRCAPQR